LELSLLIFTTQWVPKSPLSNSKIVSFPVEDEEISKQLERSFKKAGINIMTQAEVTHVDTKGQGVTATIKTIKGEETLKVDIVLSAVGIKTNIEKHRFKRGWNCYRP
jgi:pyruvate/2-oxoglutarate dehydrogenase complex dihydrolipoamide dehydrogenase (E3) component